MEFLVYLQSNVPPDMPADRREELVAAEQARSRELKNQGLIVRTWRDTGKRRVISIWEAHDATALHEALTSLPAFPYLKIRVVALARYYLED